MPSGAGVGSSSGAAVASGAGVISGAGVASAVAEDEVLGYGGMHTVLGESYVDNIAVFPEFRGHGVGRTLMAALIEKARENGGVFITLEVRASNLPAIAMYRSLGFTEAGVRRNFYTEPREDALIFTLSF